MVQPEGKYRNCIVCNAYYAITMFNSNEFAEKITDHDKTYVLKSPYVEQAQQWGINSKIDHISIGGEAWTLFKWKEKRFLSCEKMKDFTVWNVVSMTQWCHCWLCSKSAKQWLKPLPLGIFEL